MSGWLEGLGWGEGGRLTEAQALERYRYLVRTASPEMLEVAHRQAFSRWSPQEQGVALQDLNARLSPIERVPSVVGIEPSVFSRAATRAELDQPGLLERAFANEGGPIAAGLLAAVVASFIETAQMRGLLGVFDEGDPVEAEAVEVADPGSDQAFGEDAEYADAQEDAAASQDGLEEL